MRRFLLRSFVCVLGLWTGFAAGAQSGPRFEASASTDKVSINSSFEVVFTLFDAEGTRFQAPDFSAFEVDYGPATRINASFVNGKAKSESAYVYSLRPRRAGTFTIGSASIQVGNTTLRTQPLRILVQPGKTTARGEAFAEARPSQRKIWVGQQLVLDYLIYLSDPDWSVSIAEESDYDGMTAIPWGNTAQGKERIKGTEYNTLTERISLYPQQSGSHTIGPLRLDVMEWQRDQFSPFGHSTKRTSIATEPVEIEVMSLPDGAPPAFTGAVGRFVMQCDWPRTHGSTDETFVLKMTIAGNGDMKRVEAPALRLPDGLQGYPPKISDAAAPKSYQQQTAQREIEYLITANRPGEFSIQPQFVYFDTDSAKYVTLSAGPFTLEATPGSNLTDVAPKEDLPAAARTGRSVRSWLLPAIGSLALLASVAVVFLLLRRRKKTEAREPIQPELHPRERLSSASKYLLAGNVEAFYGEISAAMYEFCGRQLGIPPSEWTRRQIRQAMMQQGYEASLMDGVEGILEAAERARYARLDMSASAAEVYKSAVELMERMAAHR
jgi:hypothetical protein